MWVRQFVAHGGGCSYLLICPTRRVAALLHPDPSMGWAYERAREELGLRFLYVLETEQVDIREVSRADRFESLISNLGLSTADLTDTPLPRDVGLDLRTLPYVRPVRAWAHSDPFADQAPEPVSGVMVLQVGNRLIEVASPARPDLDWFTAGDQEEHGFTFTFGRARVKVGDHFVEIVPVPERTDAISYRVGDRLFTGAAVLAGSGVGRDEGTPPSLLSLPPDTLVYPSKAVCGVGVSTIGLERSQLDRMVGSTRRRTATPDNRPSPGAAGPLGERSPMGYVELHPEEAWRHLAALRIVDIRNPREAVDRLPGAELVAVIDLQQTLASWDRNRPILVVSEAGLRSDKAASMAVRMGFTTVYHLVGGMELWRDSGLPLRADPSHLHELP